MTRSDQPEDPLGRCLADPGYTPPGRALEPLLIALIHASEQDAKLLERALARSGLGALHAAARLLPRRAPEERTRLIGLFARLAGAAEDPALYSSLLAGLDEPLAQSRKLAARGLAKLGDERAEGRLLEALERADGAERKSVVDALGALGGAASARRFATLTSDDPDLERRRVRASLLIERRRGRADAGGVRLDVPLGRPWRVALSCRPGLVDVLRGELPAAAGPQPRGAARVDVEHSGTLAELLEARTALDVALVVPLKSPNGLGVADRIAEALARPECLEALARWTQGTPRFRVSWTSGGHRRALTWELASALRARTTAIVNDSHAARWTLRASPDGDGELHLVPRLDPDPRFAYRRADVPAASHPTLAAALARLGGAQPDEVVWDPFVGSGLELVERARLGPVRELWGSDIDARALAAARANLDAAGLAHARLVEASALEFAPPGPSLILTNPPMGRRVARDGSLGALLEGFLRHAAEVLRPGGRLVWLSPLAARTERVARHAGLEVSAGPEVDLGGFLARVQICRRRP